MGNDPTKSQQIQSAFPDYKILPELSLHPGNIYQLLMVVPTDSPSSALNNSPSNKQSSTLYGIKETASQPSSPPPSPHVLQAKQTRAIGSKYYSLYEWPEMSLEKCLALNPGLLTRDMAIYLTQLLVRQCGELAKLGLWTGLETEGVRCDRGRGGGLLVRLVPWGRPDARNSDNSGRSNGSRIKEGYVGENGVRQLGQYLLRLFKINERAIGIDILEFIGHRLARAEAITTWEAAERECRAMGMTQSVYVQLQGYKDAGTSREDRSVSPMAVGRREASPFACHNANTNMNLNGRRDVSPQRPATRTSHHNYTSNMSHLSNLSNVSNVPRVVSGWNQNKPITSNNIKAQEGSSHKRYQEYYRPVHHMDRPLSPMTTNIHQYSSGVVLHQRPQLHPHVQVQGNNYGSTGGQKKVDTFGEMKVYETITIPPEQQQQQQSVISKPSPQQHSPLKTRAREQQPANPQNHNISRSKAKPPTTLAQQPPKQLKLNLPTPLSRLPLFCPSPPDTLPVQPRLGVPILNCQPRTLPDKSEPVPTHNPNTQVSTQLNAQVNAEMEGSRGEPEIRAHFSKASNLLGSSIPVVVEPGSESIGLSMSSDSEGADYEGTYEGSWHPNFPQVRHGSGRLVFPSGGSYQGNFKWNKMDGWGKLFYPSGRLAYEGYWKNSKFQGYGKLFNQAPRHIELLDYSDFNTVQGDSEEGYWKYYEGDMKDDVKEGHGVWVMENGEKYDGEFTRDMVHGQGVFYGKRGVLEGHWEHNKLVRVLNRH